MLHDEMRYNTQCCDDEETVNRVSESRIVGK